MGRKCSNNILWFIAIGMLSGLTIMGCSTKKNRLINRTYHNTTSHYNGYFNAKESFKEGRLKIEDEYKDDYTEVLNVFKLPTKETAPGIYPQMDRAIEKCSKVIDKHSMYISRKERNKWIDDCFFLIGKSHFYKQDWQKARIQFDYVAKAFKEDDEMRYTAMLWLVRCAIEAEDFDRSGRLLDVLTADKDFPDKMKQQYSVIYADFYLQQKNYQLAMPELKNAIDLTKKKKERARLMFILAQLYQKTDNNGPATELYADVAKMNPSDEMTFHAKINQALAFDVNSGNFEEVKELLMKMARDEKNEDYLDQIYYALGEMELREGRENDGMSSLSTSIAHNTENPVLKGKAYLKLGEIYYMRPEYIPAAAYYDSAVSVLTTDFPNYQQLMQLRTSLVRIAKDMETVQHQDSLLMVVGMPADERAQFIEGLRLEAEGKAEAERLRKEQELLELQERKANTKDFNKRGGEWYFYNPQALNFGEKDFRSLWGERELEDDWRRKNKKSATLEEVLGDETEEADSDSLATKPLSPTSTEYYTKDLPLTDAAQSVSHNLIIEALYEMGVIFHEEVKDNYMAIETFEDLVSRYDTCRHTPDAYYRLHKLYLAEGNSNKAEHYENLIYAKFPNSKYATILKDPEYFAKQAAKISEQEDAYEFAFQTFKEKQYRETIFLCRDGLRSFPESELVPKFALLQALAIGKVKTEREFIAELHSVTQEYAGTEEAKTAQEYIDMLSGKSGNIADESVKEVIYEYDPETKHDFVLLIPNKAKNMNTVKSDISNFNKKSFSGVELTVSATLLDLKTQMVTVKGFEDMQEAMDYFRAFKVNKYDVKELNTGEYPMFIISFDNFARFFQDKNADTYNDFFVENYRP